MARGEALRLGPFIGGMNIDSDATTVADSELVDCVNFELDIDGSLVGRPPIVETTAPSGGNVLVIGRAIIAGVSYVILGVDGGGVYAFRDLGGGVTSITTIHATLESKVALQYRDNVYIVPAPGTKATQNGGRWDGTTFTADANMPEGEAAVFHKARMYVVPGVSATSDTSRVQYTDVITSTTFTWGSFTDISPGDGEKLIDIIIYNDNLMLFKQDSTYVLAYDLNPSDAIVRSISSTIGATTFRCVAAYENSVFIYHEGRVYEIVNYDFAQINLKVPFEYDGLRPAGTTRVQEVFLCTLGNRLIVRYYNRTYVYGLKTRTWGRWESASETLHNFGPLMGFPDNPTEIVNTKYYAGSCLDTPELMFIPDGWDSSTVEEDATAPVAITCSLRTKNYDLADSHHYKKLMWWGADVYTNQDITANVTPIITSFKSTWGDLAAHTWGDLNTWLQPLETPQNSETSVSDDGAVLRKFVRFRKSLRFRQLYFEVTLQYDGTTLQGPCRVFTLTAIMASKQTVSKQVT